MIEGDLVIANEFDRPCARLVAEVVSIDRDKATFKGEYLDESLKGQTFDGLIGGAVPVWQMAGFNLWSMCNLNWTGRKQTLATYYNGEPRPWQPEIEHPRTVLDNDRPLSVFTKGLALKSVFMDIAEEAFIGVEIGEYVPPLINRIMSEELGTLGEIENALTRAKGFMRQDALTRKNQWKLLTN